MGKNVIKLNIFLMPCWNISIYDYYWKVLINYEYDFSIFSVYGFREIKANLKASYGPFYN